MQTFTSLIMISAIGFVAWVVAQAIINERAETEYSYLLGHLKKIIEDESGEVTLPNLVLASEMPVPKVRDFLEKVAFELEADTQHDERGRIVYYFEK